MCPTWTPLRKQRICWRNPRWRRIMNKYFALRLKYLREKHGFSQAELADRIGVSRGSISFYENNSRVPDIDVLGLLCDFFSVSSDYLLGRSDQFFPPQSSASTLLGVEQNTLSPAMREACAKFQSDLHRLYNTASKTEFERFFPVVSKGVTDLIIHLSLNTSKGGEGND